MIAVILQDTVLIGTLFYKDSGIYGAKGYFDEVQRGKAKREMDQGRVFSLPCE